jgi:hypothetical protein
MDTGTIIAIAVPNAVTALALWVTWSQGKSQLAHSRELSDLAAVRELVDEIAVDLRWLLIHLHEVTEPATQKGQSPQRSDAELGEAATEFTARGEKLDVAVERLRSRFGSSHIIVLALEEAVGACSTAHLETQALIGEVDWYTGSKEGVWERIKDARNARDLFMETAQRVAGVSLPSPESVAEKFGFERPDAIPT